MTEDVATDRRKLARELMLKAKFYRAAATLFLVVGSMIFAVIYFSKVDGQLLDAMRQPLIVVSLIMPFLPAAVLAKLSDKAHRQFKALMTALQAGEGKPEN